MKIAAGQRKHLDLLRETLTRLAGGAGREARPAFNSLQLRLDDWATKIAVIGQVKAGKSTFMNAFLGYQSLLPSDVNPWTSVVTSLRINKPADPETGCRFTFFEEADWAEITEGNSRVRKLAEEMLPGFDASLLRRQSREMQERARRRLGRHYHALLGSRHEYDFITPDLLQRYVCAGHENEPGFGAETTGRYSLLTRYAEVYLRRSDFLVPAVLTDTPGVNDPFLVRDEITCRSLDHSDLFIMVLSAHQALTEVDIALIRILARQESKDVLIFINRIDELDDYLSGVPQVTDDVVDRLSEAIPEIGFTVVPGSAWLAELAQRDDPEALALCRRYDTPQLAAYLRELYGVVPDHAQDRLYLASGMDALKYTLSNAIDEGAGCRTLAQLHQDIRSEIGGVQLATREARHSIRKEIETLAAARPDQALGDISRELGGLEELYMRLIAQFEQTSLQLDKLLTRSWTRLEKSLNATIETFMEEQKSLLNARVLRESIARQSARQFSITTLALQDMLSLQTREAYQKCRAGTDVILSNCLTACETLIATHMAGQKNMIALSNLPHDEFVPTLVLAKGRLNLDLVFERSWSFWQKRKVDIGRTLEMLRLLAAAELRPSVEKLLKACNEAQAERAGAGMERLRVLLRSFELSISERRHRMMRDKRQLELIDPLAQKALTQRLQSQLEVLERRLHHLSIADAALDLPDLAAAA